MCPLRYKFDLELFTSKSFQDEPCEPLYLLIKPEVANLHSRYKSLH